MFLKLFASLVEMNACLWNKADYFDIFALGGHEKAELSNEILMTFWLNKFKIWSNYDE